MVLQSRPPTTRLVAGLWLSKVRLVCGHAVFTSSIRRYDVVESETAGGMFGWNRSQQYLALNYNINDQQSGMIRCYRNSNNGSVLTGYRGQLTPSGTLELRQDGLRIENTITFNAANAYGVDVQPLITPFTTNVLAKLKEVDLEVRTVPATANDAAYTATTFNNGKPPGSIPWLVLFKVVKQLAP